MPTVNWVGTLLGRQRMMGSPEMIARINVLLILLATLPGYTVAKEYSEQSLRTLFTSQQERQDIDSGRRGKSSPEDQDIVEPSSIQVNGIVKRSDGKNVVWINGKNTMDSSTVDGIKVYSNSINVQGKVPVMIDGQKVYIKPGETWSGETGVSGVGD